MFCGVLFLSPYGLNGEQNLFHLSKKTAMDLAGIAKENLTERKQDVFILPGDRKNSVSPEGNGFRIQYNDNHRFRSAPALKSGKSSVPIRHRKL